MSKHSLVRQCEEKKPVIVGTLCVCWCMVVLVVLAASYIVFAYFGTPGGCWFGACSNIGVLYHNTGSSIGDSFLNVQGSFEKGESWKYYELEVDTYANNLVVYSGDIVGEICLGVSSISKPHGCNLGTEYTTGNLICKHPSSVVIGVSSKYLDNDADNRNFSFNIFIDNPYNSMAGVGCGFALMFYCGILFVLALVWVLPLLCCTIFFVLRKNKTYTEHEYDKLSSDLWAE